MIKILSKTDVWKVLDANRADKKGDIILRGLHLTKDYVEATDGKMLFRAGRANFGIPSDAPVVAVIMPFELDYKIL